MKIELAIAGKERYFFDGDVFTKKEKDMPESDALRYFRIVQFLAEKGLLRAIIGKDYVDDIMNFRTRFIKLSVYEEVKEGSYIFRRDFLSERKKRSQAFKYKLGEANED